MADDHRLLESARTPRASPAGPGVEALRVAYLDVLKLCLCDLGGKTTTSVWKHTDDSVMSRELSSDELRIRSVGMDWPLHGLTMIGLERLDDLQACVESVVREGVAGDLIEAGTWRGGASILMRATLDALGAADRTVWVADSFQGFPIPDEDHPDREDLAAVDFLAVPVEEVRANFARFGYERGVRFVPGFFEETMPTLTGLRWAVVRLDGDSYEATWTTLQALYPGLSVGGYLIVDDYGALKECRQAVDEFRDHHAIAEPLERIDWTGARWQRASDAPIETAAPPHIGPGRVRSPARAVPREHDARVTTLYERALRRDKRHLERDLADERRRLITAEAEIRRLHRSPLRGPAMWLKLVVRRLRRVLGPVFRP